MIRLIIWVIVGLLALSFFGISLQELAESDTNQENVNFIWQLFSAGWDIIKGWFADVIAFFRALIGQ
jgi:hypothetical protein